VDKEIKAEQWYKEAKAILDAKLKQLPQSNSSSKPLDDGNDEDDSDSW
jgi:hypothetical protein